MKPYINLKKIAVTLILLLLCCDVSLLFAADQMGASQPQAPTSSSAKNDQLSQLQQMSGIIDNVQPNATGNQAPSLQSQAVPPPQTQPQPVLPAPSAQLQPNNNSVAVTQNPALAAQLPGNTVQQTLPTGSALAGSQTTTPITPDQVANEAAFAGTARSILPMSPEQIQRLKQMFNASQYAASADPAVPPKPVIRSQFVNLAPGTLPPPIRLKQGVVTSLAFLDSTGQPWPIDAYDIGDPVTFNVQWNKTDNILFVQPTKQYYDDRNLVVRLKGLATPVTLTLLPPNLSSANAVDYRVDLHLSGLGPNASPVETNQLPNSANTELLAVLGGIPPAGARELKIAGRDDSQAWVANDKLYVRTRLTILSPGWLATMSSADGMKAYEMQKTPMILVSQNGRAIQLKIEGL